MKNILIGNGICKEYCDRKCRTCNQTKTDCVECSEFYTKDEKGECVMASQSLSIFVSVRPFLNVLKKVVQQQLSSPGLSVRVDEHCNQRADVVSLRR